MAYFQYQATSLDGQTRQGLMEANDEGELYRRLREADLFLLRARPARAKRIDRSVRLNRKERLEISHHLATVLVAGIGILTALEDLANHVAPRHRQMVATLADRVRGGDDLSAAMNLFPDAFPETFVRVIEAGEATGSLAERFQDLVADLEWQVELRRLVRKATVYPITVVVALVGLVALILTVVVPQFASVFEQVGVELPLPTRVVMVTSRFVAGHATILGGGVAALVVGVWMLRRFSRGRYLLDRLLLSLPVLGGLRAKLAVAMAAHLLGLLYRAGVGLLKALQITSGVVASPVYQSALRRAGERVREGATLSEALGSSGCFPSLFLRMVQVGESTGDLDTTLARVNRYFRAEVPRTVEMSLAVLQPTLLAILGAVVGGVALSVFLPMYRMMDVIQ
ncbi:MAG TPA: type II secretion system F family protein [bacterium]|jgi:type IV pilus assembly protein PilC